MGKAGYLVLVCAGVGVLSWCLRALPFLLFGRKGEPPRIVAYVGRVLSPAAIAMLVVYCYAGYAHDHARAFMAPEAVAGCVTAALGADENDTKKVAFRNTPVNLLVQVPVVFRVTM